MLANAARQGTGLGLVACTSRSADHRAAFARCVRERTRPEVSGEEGIANIAVLEAIVESAKTGRAADVAGR